MFNKSPRSYIKPEDCRRLIQDLKNKGVKNINSYLKKAFDNCLDCPETDLAEKPLYVRPSGSTYGTGDGSSYNNAWSGFTSIQWNELENKTLAVCGTHLETLSIQQNNIKIIGNDENEAGIIDGKNTINFGLSVNGFKNVKINYITIINSIISNINLRSDSSGETNNVTLLGSGNQSIQHYGTSQWTHNNTIASNNVDDGISTHDDSVVIINNGVFDNNGEGCAAVQNSSITINDSVFTNNTKDVTNQSLGVVNINKCSLSSDISSGVLDSTTTITNVKDSEVTNINNIYLNAIASYNIDNCIVNGAITPGNDESNYNVVNSLILSEIGVGGKVSITDCYYKPQTSASRTNNLSINRCLIDGEGSTDFILDFPSGGECNITNTVFINIPSTRYAIVLRSGVNFVRFDNNTIIGDNNGQRGLFLVESNYVINNCIFLDLENVDNAVGFTFNNCSFFNITNTINGVQNNSVTGDPLFIDVANKNYILQEESPCIGAGVNITIPDGVNSALWGNGTTEKPNVISKPRISPYDIGAYVKNK